MWAGSLGGLNVWLKNTDSFKTYKKGGHGSINDNIVRAIYQPSPEKLYVGTEQGLNVLDVARQNFTSYTNKSNDQHSISDNAVYSIYPDKEGGIWLFWWNKLFSRKGIQVRVVLCYRGKQFFIR
jgi:ligand-binding sensor domain-containing protein